MGWDSALYNALEFVVFLNRLEFMDYWSLGALTKRMTNWNFRNLLGAIGTGCREPGKLKHGFSFGEKRALSLHRALTTGIKDDM